MSFPRFLLDAPLTGPGEYTLGREESHHAATVMRLRQDDGVIVFDGFGHRAEAVIIQADKSAVRVRVDAVATEKPGLPHLTIATGIPKGKRWQALLEKCTELGVDRIIPLLSARSVVKGEGDPEKWRRWIVEAAKQSRRAWLPEIWEPTRLTDIPPLAAKENAVLLVADRDGEPPTHYRGQLEQAGRVVAMVGPEGGVSDEESEYARNHGALGVVLSPFVLRIETAAATVCAVIREMSL
jgi:16S rRNA (uracil1498-N3)-methyltransferase